MALQPINEYLHQLPVFDLEYFNSVTGSASHLTTAADGYIGYTCSDIVACVLDDMELFTMQGDLARPFSSLYDTSLYSTSTLHSNTAVENLMAFFMAIDILQQDGFAVNEQAAVLSTPFTASTCLITSLIWSVASGNGAIWSFSLWRCWSQPLFLAFSFPVKAWCWWQAFLQHKGYSISMC